MKKDKKKDKEEKKGKGAKDEKEEPEVEDCAPPPAPQHAEDDEDDDGNWSMDTSEKAVQERMKEQEASFEKVEKKMEAMGMDEFELQKLEIGKSVVAVMSAAHENNEHAANSTCSHCLARPLQQLQLRDKKTCLPIARRTP